MRIAHISDQHGVTWPTIPDKNIDLILITGDNLPNVPDETWLKTLHIDPIKEAEYQAQFVKDNIEKYKNFIKDRPVMFLDGNHDFFNPTELLIEHGINAQNLTNELIDFNGFQIYGFPYIPYMAGDWNYELNAEQMGDKVRELDAMLIYGVDILAAHCPLPGLLSGPWGNVVLGKYFIDELEKELYPKLYCCGHSHSEHGVAIYKSMLASNAATTCNILNVWKE